MTVSSAILLDHTAEHAPALMQVAGLCKRYGEQRALVDISFAVNAGEVLGLIGPNGAGKTTLMEAVAAVLAADDGRILWRGTSLALPQRREFMFYLPDGLRPWEGQYAAEVIAFFAAVYGRPEIVVADTIRSLGLAPVLRKRIAALSKGYGRRLMLALALLAMDGTARADREARGRVGGGVPCAHLTQPSFGARRSIHCSPRRCARLRAAARCGPCC